MTREQRLEELLRELHALVCGECPSLLNGDSGGKARLDLDIRAALSEQPEQDAEYHNIECDICGEWTSHRVKQAEQNAGPQESERTGTLKGDAPMVSAPDPPEEALRELNCHGLADLTRQNKPEYVYLPDAERILRTLAARLQEQRVTISAAELAARVERGEEWKIAAPLSREIDALKADLSAALDNHSADLSAVPIAGRSGDE